jgi:hypothetical protein
MATDDGKTDRPDQAQGPQSAQDGNVVSLGRDIQVKIGQHLRTMYDEVVKQGIPDQFNDLLQQLDNSAAQSGGKSTDRDRRK